MKKIYQHTQVNALLWILSVIIIGAQVIVLLKKETLENNIALIPIAIVTLVLVLASLIFTRLTITITNKHIEAAFGFRAFVQKMTLEDIDPSKIEIIKTPLSYGIGLRMTPKGTLYNTRHGKSLHITSKDGKKTFFIGSKNAEEIKAILLKELR
jgi:hypothetical protein